MSTGAKESLAKPNVAKAQSNGLFNQDAQVSIARAVKDSLKRAAHMVITQV